MTRIAPEVIETEHLVLVPLDDEVAEEILRRDFSCLNHVPSWPHDDTLDAVLLRKRDAAVWLVGLNGFVIGDCGTAGPVEAGTVEIGFGLAEEKRGKGYGSEMVRALSDWLLALQGVERLVAETDIVNVAARRVLEHAGFVAKDDEDGVVRYAR